MYGCVDVCVRMCVHVCMRARVCVHARVCLHMFFKESHEQYTHQHTNIGVVICG